MTPASFEPTIDYVVTKIPRWAFEKLPGTSGVLGTQMQSVGEVMAIGRTFPESLQKALRSLEQGRAGFNADSSEIHMRSMSDEELLKKCAIPTPDRIFQVGEALRRRIDVETVQSYCLYDHWYLDQMISIIDERLEWESLAKQGVKLGDISRAVWRRAKRLGFSDVQLAFLLGSSEREVRAARKQAGVITTFKTVDTCSAEFDAKTPYHYSTYEDENEVRPSSRPRVIILGSGPNRIGQGIEFDYCCVHASFALRDAGYETVMLNCNPETVSTDYDTSDRLYFEPLTYEDVQNVIEAETLASGGVEPKVIVSLGGQTPLKLASQIDARLIAGTSPNSIDLAEDRERWNALCEELFIPQPPGGTATTFEQARDIASRIGYPVLVRPSYVLGGRAMQIVHDVDHLERAMKELAREGSLGREGGLSAERPILVDHFLEDAIEVDVDAVRDITGEVLIGGVMEHVEEAGVHSGDSACAIPPQTLPDWVVEVIHSYAKALANALEVVGLLNVQFAVSGTTVYVIEANPRASRTVPFVAKATGVPLAKVATRVMLGATLNELRTEGLLTEPVTGHVSVKEAVLPFSRFPEVDTALGPEMRSTGEVMGIDSTFGLAFVKAETAAGTVLPTSGLVFLSLADRDKPAGLVVAQRLRELGLGIAATSGTATYLSRFGVVVDRIVAKVSESTIGSDTAVGLIESGEVAFVVNTPRGGGSRSDGQAIRKAANVHHVSSVTTIEAALAAFRGLIEQKKHPITVCSLQEFHQIGRQRASQVGASHEA